MFTIRVLVKEELIFSYTSLNIPRVGDAVRFVFKPANTGDYGVHDKTTANKYREYHNAEFLVKSVLHQVIKRNPLQEEIVSVDLTCSLTGKEGTPS